MKFLVCLAVVFIHSILFAQTPDNTFVYPQKDSISSHAINKNVSDSLLNITTVHRKVYTNSDTDLKWAQINKDGGLNNHHNLWLGLNVEPQFQNVFKSRKEFKDYAQQTGGYLKLPAEGGVQTGFKLYYLPAGIAGFETGLQYHFYESGLLQVQTVNAVPVSYWISNKYHNLEVPLFIDVHTHGRNVRFYSSDGISAGVTLGASHLLSYSAPGYVTQTTLLKTPATDSTAFFYCTLLASAGMQVSITPHILFNLALAFRISTSGVLGATNPYYTPGRYAFVPYSLGLNAEMLFQTHKRNKNRNGNFSLPATVSGANDKEQKKQDKLKEKHQSWHTCFVVMLNGDTIRAKVRESEDYALAGFLFNGDKFMIAHADEREEKLGAAQIKELYVAEESREFRKYISIASRNEVDNREIFRVLSDGQCQLLTTEINGPGIGAPLDKAYVYYKNKLTPISLKAAVTKSQEFKDQCKEIFTDCPSLLLQLQNNTRNFPDMPAIVKAFNECINTH